MKYLCRRDKIQFPCYLSISHGPEDWFQEFGENKGQLLSHILSYPNFGDSRWTFYFNQKVLKVGGVVCRRFSKVGVD